MFKVGDRGKTRGLNDYVIISVTEHNEHAGTIQNIRAIIDGDDDDDEYYFCGDGRFSLYGKDGTSLDLMPPDSHDYNTESESVPAKDEQGLTCLAELAALAERHAISIEYRVDDKIYLFTRTSSLT